MQPTRRFSGSRAHQIWWATVIATSLVAGGTARAAQDIAGDISEPDLTTSGRSAGSGPVNVLPDALAARVNAERVTATTWAGYDGGKRAPFFSALVEARIIGRLVILGGAGYSAEMPSSPALRPQIGLRAQLLDQGRHGVDGGVAVMYRQDLFSIEGGFFQGAVALERRQGRARLVANLLYGQDGEGDDRDGDARLATLFEVQPGLLLGLDVRYRHALWSTDPNRFVRDRPESELVAGPTASYALGSWTVMAETGLSAVRTTSTQAGVIALAGVGSCF